MFLEIIRDYLLFNKYVYILGVIIINYIIYKYNNKNKIIQYEETKTKYYLGQILDKESLEIEYKEFCLKDKKFVIKILQKKFEKELQEHEIIEFIMNGKITKIIMNIIYHNIINNYIEKFIPKYISSFCNSRIDGEILIGVNDDDNEISGIPFLTNSFYTFNETYIKSLILKQFKNINCLNVNDQEIMDSISVELIELDYMSEISQTYLRDDDKEIKLEIKKYYETMRNYDIQFKNYVKNKKENWMKYYSRYHIGLQTFIDRLYLREELIEYINKFNIDGKYDNIIKLLKDKKKILLPSGNIIKILKNNDNNLIYWLTRYRDLMKDEILKKKPKKPILNLQKSLYPELVFKRLSLIKTTISQNKENINNGLKFYMIKIKINGNRFKNSKFNNMNILYKDILKIKKEKELWVSGYRCIINNEPYCSNNYKFM